MRVKIHVLAPLPEQKVLLPLEPDATAASLASLVATTLLGPSLGSSICPSPDDLVLEIDGFQLLPAAVASLSSLLEPSDVITVRLKPSSSTLGKRKVSGQDIGRGKRLAVASPEGLVRSVESRPVIPSASKMETSSPAVVTASPSSHLSSDTSSLTSSNSDSGSDSDSDSTSDTDSESSDSSEPSDTSSSSASTVLSVIPGSMSIHSAESLLVKPVPTMRSSLTDTNSVPPGLGKASTHERNARRRRAKLLRKAANESTAVPHSQPQTGSQGKSVSALGASSPAPSVAATTTFTTSELPVPRNMENRNKKKGFLKAMAKVRGTKTVFETGSSSEVEDGTAIRVNDESVEVSVSDPTKTNPLHADNTNGATQVHAASFSPPPTPIRAPELPLSLERDGPLRASFLAPSELPSLPSNVFVTSKVFTFVTDRERRKLARLQQVDQTGSNDTDEVESSNLRYTPTTGDDSLNQSTPPLNDDIWARVEVAYNSLPLLDADNAPLLVPGTIIAFKEVMLDFATFSPQIALHLARLQTASNEEIRLERIPRPRASDDVWWTPGADISAVEQEPVVIVLSQAQLRGEEGKRRIVSPDIAASFGT